MDFELAYYDVVVKDVNHCTTAFLERTIERMNKKVNVRERERERERMRE